MSNSKKCAKCEIIKDISMFAKSKKAKVGVTSYCKECFNKKNKEYRLSKKGVLTSLYCDQKSHSKTRGHPMPSYTKNELKDWLFSQSKFHHLHHLWRVSNYDKVLKPSIDRKDDYLPYSFSNIQLCTWGENKQKQSNDIRFGTSTSGSAKCKAVLQISKKGYVVAEYFSAREAKRQTLIGDSDITRVCRGGRKYAGGYMWKFKNKDTE